MATRDKNDIVRQMRNILTDLDELKTVQRVGTNQIVAKPYETADAYDRQFSITAPFQSAGSSFKVLRITVSPTNLPAGNILISDFIPKLMYTNGARVSNWDYVNNVMIQNTFYFMVYVDPEDDTKNTYLVGIIAPTGTVMRLKVYITANATVGFTIEEIN